MFLAIFTSESVVSSVQSDFVLFSFIWHLVHVIVIIDPRHFLALFYFSIRVRVYSNKNSLAFVFGNKKILKVA